MSDLPNKEETWKDQVVIWSIALFVLSAIIGFIYASGLMIKSLPANLPSKECSCECE